MDLERFERPVAISPVSVESRFFSRVYAHMGMGLVLTALVAWFTASSPAVLQVVVGNRLVFFGLMIGELALVAWLSGLIGKMSASTATGVFLFYSALNGLTLSVIVLLYTRGSIASTFLVTAGTFGAMSAYGFVTKRSLAGLGSFCFMGLIGVILASIVNMFLRSNMLEFVLSVVGVIVFVGLTAYDTRKLKMLAQTIDVDSEGGRRASVVGALSLYLDFINLFLMLLRLFGRRR
jgi:FtsH-binding integral membrane protein